MRGNVQLYNKQEQLITQKRVITATEYNRLIDTWKKVYGKAFETCFIEFHPEEPKEKTERQWKKGEARKTYHIPKPTTKTFYFDK